MTDIRGEYRRLLRGTHTESNQENVVFYVHSTSLDEGRGDLFVALGLARALDVRGWGVSFLGLEHWHLDVPPHTTITVAMLQDATPGHARDDVLRLAWVRNWVEDWVERAPLAEFDGILASSEAAEAFIRKRFMGATATLPIGVDAGLFAGQDALRDVEISTTLNLWGHDRGLVDDIRKLPSGFSVHWFGNGLKALEDVGEVVVIHDPVDFVDVAGVYGRSKIVLDDLTPSTREFGCQNSRLYEGLAAGALVITNCAEGLSELGLSGVPVVTDNAPLEAILQQFLDDEEGRFRLVSDLRSHVLLEHTYEVRAEAFMQFVEKAKRHVASRQQIMGLQDENAQLSAECRLLREALDGAEEEIRRFRARKAVHISDRVASMFWRRR
ncbi:glycosyltransferase family protein [Leucobacter sp. Z1108]|uniref:glycosyltransferase family protein n=1 Tax=Leucobacter sp. Z1108 TaxID=3439066 RepID=UPI003F2C9E59